MSRAAVAIFAQTVQLVASEKLWKASQTDTNALDYLIVGPKRDEQRRRAFALKVEQTGRKPL